jgi:hypothetical protein
MENEEEQIGGGLVVGWAQVEADLAPVTKPYETLSGVAAEAAVRLAVAVEADERAGRLRVEPGPLAQALQVFREAAEAAGWIED